MTAQIAGIGCDAVRPPCPAEILPESVQPSEAGSSGNVANLLNALLMAQMWGGGAKSAPKSLDEISCTTALRQAFWAPGIQSHSIAPVALKRAARR